MWPNLSELPSSLLKWRQTTSTCQGCWDNLRKCLMQSTFQVLSGRKRGEGEKQNRKCFTTSPSLLGRHKSTGGGIWVLLRHHNSWPPRTGRETLSERLVNHPVPLQKRRVGQVSKEQKQGLYGKRLDSCPGPTLRDLGPEGSHLSGSGLAE